MAQKKSERQYSEESERNESQKIETICRSIITERGSENECETICTVEEVSSRNETQKTTVSQHAEVFRPNEAQKEHKRYVKASYRNETENDGETMC